MANYKNDQIEIKKQIFDIEEEKEDDRFDYENQGCLHEMFERQVRKTPQAVVVVVPSSEEIKKEIKNEESRERNYLTLQDLNSRVSLLSTILRQKYDVLPDTCVGIYMEKCPEYVIAYISILKAGGGYMPLDISYPKTLLRSILDEARPKAICTKPEFVHVFENGKLFF